MTALPRGESPGADTAADPAAADATDPGGTPAAEDAPAGTGDEVGAEGAPAVSEAEAEIAAQRELRERIEKRKAEKDGPIEAGGKLSGTAADLLAAVRAVESGQ
ncbi:DNA helicase RecD, partial [Streptomyces sp. SID9727]|nr:DNA helicase RecD [Streptomyces sp. SID9727]